jgi:hypothetical protein
MPDDPILKRLTDMAGEHMSVLVRQIYEAGWKAGENAAKQKVLNAFDAPASAPASAPRASNNTSISEMSKVSRPLRDAILMMNIGQDGVGPNEVFGFINQQPGPKFDIWQVRAGIKTLEKKGDLIRISRGRYRPADHLLEGYDDQAAETPNSGTLFGAPKPNGTQPLSP